MDCNELKEKYRKCIAVNTKIRECRAELDALFACNYEAEMKKKYIYYGH